MTLLVMISAPVYRSSKMKMIMTTSVFCDGPRSPYSIQYIYKNQTGEKPQKQDTQANKRSPLLSEEVPFQITLIRLRQGSLDRRRREKVTWKMLTENDC